MCDSSVVEWPPEPTPVSFCSSATSSYRNRRMTCLKSFRSSSRRIVCRSSSATVHVRSTDASAREPGRKRISKCCVFWTPVSVVSGTEDWRDAARPRARQEASRNMAITRDAPRRGQQGSVSIIFARGPARHTRAGRSGRSAPLLPARTALPLSCRRDGARRHPASRVALVMSTRGTDSPPSRDLARITLGVLVIGLLMFASLWVLEPFLAAGVWAAMVVVATWPLMLAVQARLGGQRGLAVAVMTLAILLVLVLPIVIAVTTVAQHSEDIAGWARDTVSAGMPSPPGWVEKVPFAGRNISEEWAKLAALSREELADRA